MKTRSHRTLLMLLLAWAVVWLFIMVGIAAAQDATPTADFPPTESPTLEPTPVELPDAPNVSPVIPPDVLTPADSLLILSESLMAIFAAFAGGGLTATIVSGLKYFLPDSISAPVLKNIVGAVLTMLYWVATKYGFGEAFESVGQFLIVAVPAFITLFGTMVGSSIIHDASVKYHFPVLNFERTPQVKTARG